VLLLPRYSCSLSSESAGKLFVVMTDMSPYQPFAAQPPQHTRSSIGAVWLWGSVFGSVFGVVAALIGTVVTQAVLRQAVFQGPPVNVGATMQLLGMLDLVNLLLCVAIASFLAGALSKRWIGGLIAGALFVLVTQGVSLLLPFGLLARPLSTQGLIQLALQTLMATAVLLLFGAGLGAGCGAAGALVGRAWAWRAETPTS
jgi:hypothetical protein